MAYIGKKPTDKPLTGSDLNDEIVDSDHYVDSSIDTAHIDDDQVTYAKIQNVTADERILGRVSGADGVIEELTKTQVLMKDILQMMQLPTQRYRMFLLMKEY